MERPFKVEISETSEHAFVIKDGVLYDAFVSLGENGTMGCFKIPEGVREIADFCVNFLVFSGEDAYFSRIVLPKSLEKIDPCAFLNGICICAFEIDPENPNFKIDGKFLLSKDGKRLVLYAFEGWEETGIDVPDGVEIVEENVFYNSASHHLVFPESVKEIAAQYHCSRWGKSIYASDLETIVVKNKDAIFTDGAEEMLQFAKLIKAPENSAAIAYAKEKGIAYEII